MEFREQEGREERKRRLKLLWKQLPNSDSHAPTSGKAVIVTDQASLTPEKAEAIKHIYDEELLGTCRGHTPGDSRGPIKWKEFVKYAEAKEVGK